jgi:guanylate kinase
MAVSAESISLGYGPMMNAMPSEESTDTFISDLRARKHPRLFVISGPSGVGKDSVIEQLRDLYPDIHFAVTATTRPRRPGEIDGIHYYFLDEETFLARDIEHEFIETAIVYHNHYGVPRTPVRHALERGQDVIIKVDVQGAASIRKLAPDATYIFIAPESMTELLRRLRSRKTDDPDVLMQRFSAASRELLHAREFDYVVFNEEERLASAIEHISSIVDAERMKTRQPVISI